jgi:hypothetical protein
MAKKSEKPEIESETKEVKTVLMVREGKEADVHPDEVENYRKGGYTEV